MTRVTSKSLMYRTGILRERMDGGEWKKYQMNAPDSMMCEALS